MNNQLHEFQITIVYWFLKLFTCRTNEISFYVIATRHVVPGNTIVLKFHTYWIRGSKDDTFLGILRCKSIN